ncbi:MAG: GNVR domain-containing protein, partial [Gemmatimonadota bacterium]
PQFYAQVVKSREILDRVLQSRFADPRGAHNPPDSASLLRILEVRGAALADSLHAGRKALEERVSVRVDNQTNIVTLSVDSRHPALAADVANRFVLYLNEFNAKTRQSQARERRRFVEEQVAAAERDLRGAEEELKTFYERNRSYQQSPQLVFEEGRLRRQVEIRQEVYLTLKREYETAKIEEVNDTPVITVVASAVPPQEKSKPKRLLLVVLALVLSGMVSVFWAFGAEYVDRMRREDEGEYREFRGLVGRMRDDVKAMGRRLSRRAVKGKGSGGSPGSAGAS